MSYVMVLEARDRGIGREVLGCWGRPCCRPVSWLLVVPWLVAAYYSRLHVVLSCLCICVHIAPFAHKDTRYIELEVHPTPV